MPDYNTIFMNQSRAGTGLKRTFPYTSYMTGLAEYAGSQRLSELEQERINQTADQYKRELALQNKANDIAESQAKKGAIVQGIGTATQAGRLIADPNVRSGVSKIGTKFGIGGSSNARFMSGSDASPTTDLTYEVPAATQSVAPVGEGLTYTNGTSPSYTTDVLAYETPGVDMSAGYSGAGTTAGAGIGELASSGVSSGVEAGGSAVGEGMAMVEGEAVPGVIGEGASYLGPITAGLGTGLMKFVQTGDVGEGVSHGLGAGGGALGGAELGTMIMPGVGTLIGGMLGAVGGNMLVDPIMKGASAVGDAVWEGVKDVGKGIGNVVSDVAHGIGDVVSDIGKSISKAVGCTLFGYVYGSGSKEVRYAQVYCCRYMSQETLLGYYTSAEWVKWMSEKYHLKSYLTKPTQMWYRFMLFKLGRVQKISLMDKVFSEVAMWVFRRVHSHTTHQFIPVNTCLPIIQMRDAKEVM